MKEQPSAYLRTLGPVECVLVSNTDFYIYSFFLHWGTDVSSPCHSWRTEREHAKESSGSSYSSPSAKLPKISSIQEGLFCKSTSLGWGLHLWNQEEWTGHYSQKKFFFTWKDYPWIQCYLRCCTVLKQARTTIDHRVVVFLVFLVKPSSHEQFV